MAAGKVGTGGGIRKGFTRLGPGPRGGGANAPSGIILTDAAGNDHYIWVDITGALRIADPDVVEASTFNEDADGTVVGAQS
jgi:hypothetical protein